MFIVSQESEDDEDVAHDVVMPSGIVVLEIFFMLECGLDLVP